MNSPFHSPTYKELTEKREQLKKFWDDNLVEKDGQRVCGMNADQLKEFNDRNDELKGLNDKWETERMGYEAAAQLERDLADGKKAAGESHRHPATEAEGKGEGRKSQRKSLGELVAESAEMKQRRPGQPFGVDIKGVELKTLMTTTAGYAPFVPREDRVEMYPNRRVMLLDLIPSETVEVNAVKYMEETTETNNAAPVAEGGTMPESAIVFTERTVTIEKIGHFIPVTDEQIEDVSQLRSILDDRMGYMLALAEENQLMNGTGVSPQLVGFLNKTGVQTQAKGADPIPDCIYKGFTKVRGVSAGTGWAEPSAVVMHPTDWETIRLLRTADGLYIYGQPSEAGPERIWGKPIVVTPVIAQGTALSGDFAMFAQIARRWGIRIDVSDSHSDWFVKGQLAIRAQERAALKIYRASAFCKHTGL